MSVGLVLITHNGIGDELLGTAVATLSGCPLAVRVLRVHGDSDPDRLLEQAEKLVGEVDAGAGVLVLTDIFGSTPSNVAIQLLHRDRVLVVAGLSLPMLIRVLNYPALGLPELAAKAVTGGCEGIVLSSQEGRRS